MGNLSPRQQKRNKRFRILVCALACVLFLCTVLTLMTPAFTWNDPAAEEDEPLLEAVEGNIEDPIQEQAPIRAPLRAPNYEVWFDGTEGQGTTVNYYPGATNVHVTVTNGSVTLPAAAGNPAGYELNGWYDITGGVYYGRELLGQSIGITQNTVFYADWVPKSDDYRNNNRTLADTVDISSFVTTELFDYNELINLRSGKTTSASISANSHAETWGFDANQSGGFNFAFHQWAYFDANGNQDGRIGALRNRNDRNKYHENSPTRLETGIVQSESDEIIQTLFTDSGTPGARSVGEGTHLYQFDNETGYYYYDSTKNGASYQASDGRFYVYSDPTYIQGQQLRNNTWVNRNDRSTAFMPLNGERSVSEKDGAGNFWFGMKNTIDFFLPEAPGANGGNCNYSTTGQPMEFRFSGDDDMWIFVDGELVLDLGGIHGSVSGTIDFSAGTVTQNGTTFALPASIREGEHTLTMYYLERGSSKSNCSIYFNICPRYALDLTKKDANSQELLNGAEFTVYTDEDCTIPAMLWSSKAAHESGESAHNSFTVENGRLNCWGLSAGRTYYIKETKAPENGYADVSDAVIALMLDSRGNPTVQVTGPTDLLDVTEVQRDSEIQYIRMVITNEKPQAARIRAEKLWLDATGNLTDEGEPIQLQLYRSNQQMQASGSHNVYVTTQYFSQDPPGGSNSDDDPILPGDYSRVISVRGGSDLRMELLSLAERAGFYSVTANGRTVTPENPVQGTENCYIGGSWDQYPLQSASYTLTDITADQHVVITIIGFPDEASIEQSITVGVTEITHGESGGSPEASPVKPSGAVPVGAPVTVHADENGAWVHEWIDLPVGNGSVNYYYYVEESPLNGYETTYSGNGIQWGSVTVTNRLTDSAGIRLTLLKKSAGESAVPLSGARFDLYRPAAVGENGVPLPGANGLFVKVNQNPVITGQNGRASWSGLEAGVYYLVETAAPTGYLLNETPHRIELTAGAAITEESDTAITGNAAAPAVTLTNEPKNTQDDLIVEKSWRKQIDDAGTIAPDTPQEEGIQFQLYRSYEAPAAGVPVTIVGRHSYDPSGTVLLQSEAAPGTTFRFYICGIWDNGNPDTGNSITVTCTGGTVRKLSETQPTEWSWYRAPIYEVTVPESSAGVTVNVRSRQRYDHYNADYVAGYEPAAPAGSGAFIEELVAVNGITTFTLNDGNGWHMSFNRADLNELPNVSYTYRVVETPVPSGYEVSYRTEASGVGQQIYLLIDNTKIYYTYELPQTGGSGTIWFTLIGIALIIGAAVIIYYRIKNRYR